MIVCNNKSDYKILQSLRAHGWDREIQKKINLILLRVYLRPLDISASIAMVSLRLKRWLKLENLIAI